MISLRAQSIAIIGAGPSGVVASKYLRAEKAFEKITIFEQRTQSGGIWNPTPNDTSEDIFTIPQTNPHGKIQQPTWRDNGDQKEPYFLSPIYDRLETNIPRGLMGFQDLDWPQESQLFPKHQTVLEYIQEYGKDVQEFIEYSTQVLDIQPTNSNPDSKWNIFTRNLVTDEEQEHTYDAVIVANGHFIVPYVPDIPGIKEWNERYPKSISHSKYFRKPEDFTSKKVIVVGNSASGIDISNQIASVSAHPLLWSCRSASIFSPTKISDPRRQEHPPIARFLPSTRSVEFSDGVVEKDIDAIVFATGYFYSLPFLEKGEPGLIGDGTHVQHTYQHLFYNKRPTLSFLVLNQRVIPFPTAEAQAAVLARVYAGRLSLPPLSAMREWESQTQADNGSGKTFHLLPFPKDGKYINEMAAWASTASLKEGLENEGRGKCPPVWGEWEFWVRERFATIRAAFGARGEERRGIRRVEELGFSFKEEVERKKREGEKMI